MANRGLGTLFRLPDALGCLTLIEETIYGRAAAQP